MRRDIATSIILVDDHILLVDPYSHKIATVISA
jgi:hypothetical protein